MYNHQWCCWGCLVKRSILTGWVDGRRHRQNEYAYHIIIIFMWPAPAAPLMIFVLTLALLIPSSRNLRLHNHFAPYWDSSCRDPLFSYPWLVHIFFYDDDFTKALHQFYVVAHINIAANVAGHIPTHGHRRLYWFLLVATQTTIYLYCLCGFHILVIGERERERDVKE